MPTPGLDPCTARTGWLQPGCNQGCNTHVKANMHATAKILCIEGVCPVGSLVQFIVACVVWV